MRVTKEQQSSQNAAGEQPAGVEANLPKPKPTGGESKQSNDQTQKREELTNYEVSSKSIQTTSAGFVVQNLSVAVLINRAALAASLGGKPSAEAIDAQVHEIEQLVGSAAGLNRQRGDAVKISVVDFVEFEPRPRARAGSFAGRDRRPPNRIDPQRRRHRGGRGDDALVRSSARSQDGVRSPERGRIDGCARRVRGQTPALGAPDGDGQPGESILIETDSNRDEFMEALLARRDNGPERKLHEDDRIR